MRDMQVSYKAWGSALFWVSVMYAFCILVGMLSWVRLSLVGAKHLNDVKKLWERGGVGRLLRLLRLD
jgi:hypothetical protein